MSYLIRAGLTEKYVPVDRSLILPAFKQVSIEGPSAEWDATTIGLGSFVTVPQVLMAGDAALRIKYNLQEAISRQTSPELDKAWHFLAGYISEMIDERLSIVHPKTDELFGEIYPYVEVQLKRFWACVEVLSTALLVSKTVTEGDAFSLIAAQIPGELKAKAEAFAARTINENLAEVLRNQKSDKTNLGA